MNTRKALTTGCALVMLTAPFHANALTAKAGMDACTKAMIDNLSGELGAPLGYSMDPEHKVSGRLKMEDTFHLDARHPGTDEVVGRYDCIVSRQAEVIELVTLPLTAEDASARAWKTN